MSDTLTYNRRTMPPMIGMRELARRTSEIIDQVTKTKEPAVVSRHGKPAVVIFPVDSDAVEDYVLSNAPEFVESMAQAERDFDEGKTIPWSEVRKEFLPQKDSGGGDKTTS